VWGGGREKTLYILLLTNYTIFAEFLVGSVCYMTSAYLYINMNQEAIYEEEIVVAPAVIQVDSGDPAYDVYSSLKTGELNSVFAPGLQYVGWEK
jgi:hypothetical protein